MSVLARTKLTLPERISPKVLIRLYEAKASPALSHILALYIVTRLVLTLIAVVSRIILEGSPGRESYWTKSNVPWLDIWGVWDTGWYLLIAREGYENPPIGDVSPLTQKTWVYLPLYPLTIRAVSAVTGGDVFIAGLLVSNVCFLIAAFFLYRLIKLDYGVDIALRSIKYLILFPTAFVFSGVFTESLFLMLTILAFYYAQSNRYLAVGVLGLLSALTRQIGCLLILPLAYDYLRARRFRLKKVGPDFLPLLLIPLGPLMFAAYLHFTIGDAFAFIRHQAAWGRTLANPFLRLPSDLTSPMIKDVFEAYFALGATLILLLFFKYFTAKYLIFAVYAFMAPFMTSVISMPRQLVIIFPFYILFAILGKNHLMDQLLTISFALIQGFLMVFWANGFRFIL